MNNLLIFILKICTVCVGYGQIISSGVGFSELMGENGVNQIDAFSVFNNPAALQSENLVLGLSAKNYYQIEGLNQFVLSGQLPVKFGTIGFGISRYGDELRNESLASLGFGKKLSPDFALGATLYYVSEFAEFAPSASTVIPQLGLSYQLNEEFRLGVQTRNPFQQKLKEPWDNNLNSIVSIGFQYDPFEEFSTSIQSNLDTNHGLQLGLGINYLAFKKLKLNLGGGTNPNKITAGITIPLNSFDIGVGSQYQSSLGISPQLVAQNVWK